VEKCLLTHWCNYLSWINICSHAWVPSPLHHVPVARGSAGYAYLCLFPNTVYLGTSCSNFSLWHPPPIQHLRSYENILAAVAESTEVVTPPNQFFQFKHDTEAQLFLDFNYSTYYLSFTKKVLTEWFCIKQSIFPFNLYDLITLSMSWGNSQGYLLCCVSSFYGQQSIWDGKSLNRSYFPVAGKPLDSSLACVIYLCRVPEWVSGWAFT